MFSFYVLNHMVQQIGVRTYFQVLQLSVSLDFPFGYKDTTKSLNCKDCQNYLLPE